MATSIDEILEDYNIFFWSGRFDLKQTKIEFTQSEYYSESEDKRYYDLNDILDYPIEEGKSAIMIETFEQYLHKRILQSDYLFRNRLFNYIDSVKHPEQQNSILFSVLARLQDYIIILSETEEEDCKMIMTEVCKSREFITSRFSTNLGLSTQQLPNKKTGNLSSYFRGLNKIRFSLQKNEVVLLFLMLIDSSMMSYPYSDTDLAKLLDNNVQYQDSKGNFIDLKDSKVEICKIRDEGHEDKIQKIIKLLEKTNISRRNI